MSQPFVCVTGTTKPGQSVYAVGKVSRPGGWSPAAAVKLNPTAYLLWRGTFTHLPANTAIEWKCITRRETGDTGIVDQWQLGANSVLTTAPSGYSRTTKGDFRL